MSPTRKCQIHSQAYIAIFVVIILTFNRASSKYALVQCENATKTIYEVSFRTSHTNVRRDSFTRQSGFRHHDKFKWGRCQTLIVENGFAFISIWVGWRQENATVRRVSATAQHEIFSDVGSIARLSDTQSERAGTLMWFRQKRHSLNQSNKQRSRSCGKAGNAAECWFPPECLKELHKIVSRALFARDALSHERVYLMVLRCC